VHLPIDSGLPSHLFESTGTGLINESLYPFRNSLAKKLPKRSLAGAELFTSVRDKLLKLPPQLFGLGCFRLWVLPKCFNGLVIMYP
jgi:hypothetical protein